MRTPKRVYSYPALESWFDRLEGDWEKHFSPLALEQGRSWYRLGEVRQIELSAGDAIIHGKFDKQEVYALVEWDNGSPTVRSSVENRHLGQALAAAGLYEIEELVADEISPLPREARNGNASANGTAVEEGGASATPPPAAIPEGNRPARALVILLSSAPQGLELRAVWRGADGKDESALGAARARGTELIQREREQLIRLTSLLRKAGFEPVPRAAHYRLEDMSRIAPFLRNDLPQWKGSFAVEAEAGVDLLRKGVQRLTVEAEVDGDAEDGLRFRWKVRHGGRVLAGNLLPQLLRAGVGRAVVIPELGMVKVEDAQAEILAEWRPFLEMSGEGRLPPYLIFSLFGQDRVRLELAPGLKAWRDALMHPPPTDDSLPEWLRPYQQRGVRWMRHLVERGCHALLADEMGLGKTVQVATLIAESGLDGLPHLIVCPASVVPVWKAEFARFFPGIEVEILKSGNSFAAAPVPRVWLASYTQLRRHRDDLESIEFGYAVLDEAQFIKNPDAKVTAACLELRARHRIALTGTPLENRQLDLWTLFRFLMPGLLGGRARFEQMLADDPDLVQRRLRQQIAPFVLRRTKRDVMAELPPKVEMELICPLTDLQLQEYSRLTSEGLTQLGEDLQTAVRERTISLFTLLTRLRQVCCDPDLLPWMKADLSHSGKIGFLLGKVGEVLAGGHKVVIFSQFTTLLRRVREGFARQFPGVPLFELTGKTIDRAKPIADFQETEGAGIMLVSLRAGGTGITLHAADYVFILDPWWNPAVEDQAVDRVHRIGQNRTVFVYRMITEGTIEERIGNLKSAKREIFDQLVGGLDDVSDFRHYFRSLSDLIALAPTAREA